MSVHDFDSLFCSGLAWIEDVGAYECQRCGAMVAVTDRHIDFHNRVDKLQAEEDAYSSAPPRSR